MNILRGQLQRVEALVSKTGKQWFKLTVGGDTSASTFDAACQKDVGKEVALPYEWDKTGKYKRITAWTTVVEGPSSAPVASAPVESAPAKSTYQREDPSVKNASVFTKYGIDIAMAYVQNCAGDEQRKRYAEPEQFANLCAWAADQAYETFKGLVAKQQAKS